MQLLLLCTACTVRELSNTSGACFPFPCCCVGASCARDCVFLTRDMACTTAQEIPRVHLIPHGSGACVCLSSSMEARLIALEDRLRQTEEVLVTERLARKTAEAAQQMHSQLVLLVVARDLLYCQVLSTRKRLGTPTFSGDVDVNGQPEDIPWSQWSFVFRSYLGAFDPTATRLLRQVETNVEDPVVVDNTSMKEVERRLSIQLCYVLALTCRGKALQARRVRVRCVEAAVQRVRAPSSVAIPRNAPIPLVANENGRSGADNRPMGEQGEGLRGTVRRQSVRKHQACCSAKVPV